MTFFPTIVYACLVVLSVGGSFGGLFGGSFGGSFGRSDQCTQLYIARGDKIVLGSGFLYI
jgi:hypothetical protein